MSCMASLPIFCTVAHWDITDTWSVLKSTCLRVALLSQRSSLHKIHDWDQHRLDNTARVDRSQEHWKPVVAVLCCTFIPRHVWPNELTQGGREWHTHSRHTQNHVCLGSISWTRVYCGRSICQTPPSAPKGFSRLQSSTIPSCGCLIKGLTCGNLENCSFAD